MEGKKVPGQCYYIDHILCDTKAWMIQAQIYLFIFVFFPRATLQHNR